MTPTLQLNPLGPPQIVLNGSPFTALGSQKAIALLVYLACNPDPQRRELLADLLWNASSTAQSLSNFSFCRTASAWPPLPLKIATDGQSK